jgi:glyoxylase I family protein
MKIIVEHVGIPARDVHALRDWYISKLGTELIAPTGDEPPFFVRPIGSQCMFEIYRATSSNAITEDNWLSGWRHIALRVDSLEAARKELEARGVTFIEPVKPAAGGGRILFFKDCEGNLLHLLERPADTAVR